MVQIIYQMGDAGKFEVGRIENGVVTGPDAEKLDKLLRENGWPEKPAHWILYGDYLWVTRPDTDVQSG